MKRRMWCGVKDGPRRRPCYIWRLCATWKVAQCSTRTRCGARCFPARMRGMAASRSEEHTSELQSRLHLVCRLLLEKKKWLIQRPIDSNNTILLLNCAEDEIFLGTMFLPAT